MKRIPLNLIYKNIFNSKLIYVKTLINFKIIMNVCYMLPLFVLIILILFKNEKINVGIKI